MERLGEIHGKDDEELHGKEYISGIAEASQFHSKECVDTDIVLNTEL